MLKELYQQHAGAMNGWISFVLQSTTAQFIAIILAAYILWRYWAFNLQPKFFPGIPKELPYWVPGHATAFVADSQKLIEYGKDYFGDTGEPFTITVGGRKLYILTTPEDIAAVYRNNVTLSWDAMLNDLLIGFGISKATVPKVWQKLPLPVLHNSRPELDIHRVPHLSMAHSTLDLYKRQLLPGRRFEDINDTLTGYISKSMQWKSLRTGCRVEPGASIKGLSLRKFCSDVLVDATTRTLFGNGIYAIEPDMTDLLVAFNEDAWMLVFNYPQGKNSNLHRARERILSAFSKYVRGPEQLRAGQAWLLKTSTEEQRAVGISERDRAALLLMIYWAANINPYKLAFWMLSYILFDQSLLEELRAETHAAYRNGEMDIAHLMNNCPKLEAVYNETLRIVNGALSARKIISPTVIGGKTLASGNTILIAFRQLQYSKKVFGDESSQFEKARFLEDQSLAKSLNFRPFGGGVNYCPGRFLARQEMFVFIALALNRFSLRLLQGVSQSFPELDTSTPALGINGTRSGSEIFVDIEERILGFEAGRSGKLGRS